MQQPNLMNDSYSRERQKLFDFFHDNYRLVLTESQMDDIILAVGNFVIAITPKPSEIITKDLIIKIGNAVLLDINLRKKSNDPTLKRGRFIGGEGTVPCPVCKTGLIQFSLSSSDGCIEAVCLSHNCVLSKQVIKFIYNQPPNN